LPKLHSGDTVYVPRIGTGVIEEAADVQPQVTDVDRTAIPSQPPSTETQAEQFVIKVMGAVGRPGSFVSDKEMTLTEALLQAGSVTNSMALKYVRVIRSVPMEGERVVHVDVEKYLIEGDATLLPKLYSGDTIYVPDITQEQMKDVSILITGEVLSPGSYSVSEPLDILDIISMAGGLTPNADTERIRVRREDADSYQEKIVNIDEFLKDVGSEALPEMVGPGYRIYVPTQQKSTSAIAGVTRGMVAFLADVALVFSFWRIVGD
jgi:protein involved in polysaccharide export with SLBB domain